MRFTIYGKGITVTDNLKNLLKKKFEKFDRYFSPDTEVFATVGKEKYRTVLEVTIPFGRGVLRAEAKNENPQTAVEVVVDRLEGQLRKHKTKIQKHYGTEKKLHLEEFDELEPEENEEPIKIVRTKRFDMQPMNEEEAALQMDLLGHTFFVFLNADTGDVNVVYKRKDGNYGLIVPYY